jgi:hypothetical protein
VISFLQEEWMEASEFGSKPTVKPLLQIRKIKKCKRL